MPDLLLWRPGVPEGTPGSARLSEVREGMLERSVHLLWQKAGRLH
jgi:hypothetical protein